MFFFINNVPVYCYKEYSLLTIIQFCDFIRITIPRFCYHHKLAIAGNCRMCLVELNNGIKPVIACATSISPKVEIVLDSLLVKKSRENVLEFLLINHPLDCPIRDQGGECDLQDQTLMYGSDRGRFKEMKRSVEDKDLGPIVKTIMTRCIHCTRCIRFSDEVLNIRDLGVIGRGSSSEIKMNNLFFLESELSGNIVDICPVGALTSKPFAFTARPWELKSIESIDFLDSLHSNIRIDIKGNRILRILPKANEKLNEDWISDFIRFSYESIQNFRLKYPYFSLNSSVFSFIKTNLFLRFSWEQCFEFFKIFINFKNFNLFNFISGPGIGLFNVNFFYFISRFIKNSTFNINLLPTFNIDSRTSFYISNFSDFMKSNYFLFFNLNMKENFSVFDARIRTYLNNSFYKKYVFYIGKNIKHSYSLFNIGNSFFSLYGLLRGKNLNINYFNRSVFKSISIGLFSSHVTFKNYIDSLNVFDFSSINNFNYYSNISGFFECGLNSDFSVLQDSMLNSNDISYYYKSTSIKQNDSFFIYHGSYLPELEHSSTVHNYLFLPSANTFESEDNYINLFGDLQFNNQSLDFSDKEEIKSDFYILKNTLFYFFSLYGKQNIYSSFYSFDLLFNELVFFYLNYFFLFFDSYAYFKNYNKNLFSLNVQSNNYFFSHSILNLNVKNSFIVNYSSTLKTFYKLKETKQLSSFF